MYNISEFHWISTLYNLKYWQPRSVTRTQNNWPDMRKLHDDSVSFRTKISGKWTFCKKCIPGFGNEAHVLTASPFDSFPRMENFGKLLRGRDVESLKCICSHYERAFGWFSSTFSGVAERACNVITLRKTIIARSQSAAVIEKLRHSVTGSRI